MFKIFKIFSLHVLLVIVFTFSCSYVVQAQIVLPKEIKIELNDSAYPLTSGWIDSLVNDAFTGMIHYKIVGAKRAQYYIYTQIQLPQILSLHEVLRQIILYYALLPNNQVREKEILNIFPFFESTEGDPAVRCIYIDEGEYDIDVRRWNKIPIPSQPIIEDRDIFNQILQAAFNDVQSLGDVTDKVFEKVALDNNLPVERTKIIYQNTILWQVGSQIKTE
jgi:hypothetical protein